jgi:glycosyltransferase involved in cell wall biosynthesis
LRIGILNVQVPFIRGGAEVLAESLHDELKKRGYEVDIITIPFKWYPSEAIIDSMLMARMIDIKEVNGEKIDRVVALKFPIYYANHENKVLWLCHQHRQAYDLWNTDHGDLQTMKNGNEVRKLIIECDNKFIPKARKVFTISQTVTDRLQKYNNIQASTLYPPPKNFELFKPGLAEDYFFYPSRIDPIKRQILLVQALKYCKTPVRVIIAGAGDKNTINKIRETAKIDGTSSQLEMRGYISEEEKIDLYSRSIGVYFGPYQEDYGYITLESFFSGKPVITHPDSGGPLEFVNEETGFVVNPDPKSIAYAMDRLYKDRVLAKKLGNNGFDLMKKLNINWDFVVEQLLS